MWLKRAVKYTLIGTLGIFLIIIPAGLIFSDSSDDSLTQELPVDTQTGLPISDTATTVAGQNPNQPQSNNPSQAYVPAPVVKTGGSGGVNRPSVTLSAQVGALNTGQSTTLNWASTNNPTTCTASGDWSGLKASSGTQSTGTLSQSKTYSFTLTCVNGSGSGYATVSITVSTPSGSSGGGGSVVSKPVITLSASPAVISAGASSTISWSASNSPSSCSASGSWSGSKSASGSQSTGALNSGTHTYTLSCSNSGGSDTKSVNVSVNAVVTYCGGQTPCYGPSEVAQHNTAGNCWGYNINRVINITSFDSGYHIGKSGIGSIKVSGVCGTNLASSLAGGVSAGGQTRNHSSSAKNNSISAYNSYYVGYFDANKP